MVEKVTRSLRSEGLNRSKYDRLAALAERLRTGTGGCGAAGCPRPFNPPTPSVMPGWPRATPDTGCRRVWARPRWPMPWATSRHLGRRPRCRLSAPCSIVPRATTRNASVCIVCSSKTAGVKTPSCTGGYASWRGTRAGAEVCRLKEQLKFVSLDSKSISLTKLVPSAEHISNPQARLSRMACCTVTLSQGTTTKTARSSRWCSTPMPWLRITLGSAPLSSARAIESSAVRNASGHRCRRLTRIEKDSRWTAHR